MLTKDQFAEEYATRSGVTVEWLKAQGREPAPCNCGEEFCEGWQMAYIGELRRWVASRGKEHLLPQERAILDYLGWEEAGDDGE